MVNVYPMSVFDIVRLFTRYAYWQSLWDLIWQLDINKTPTTEKYFVIVKQCLRHDNEAVKCLFKYSFVINSLNIHDASNVHPSNEALIYLLF